MKMNGSLVTIIIRLTISEKRLLIKMTMTNGDWVRMRCFFQKKSIRSCLEILTCDPSNVWRALAIELPSHQWRSSTVVKDVLYLTSLTSPWFQHSPGCWMWTVPFSSQLVWFLIMGSLYTLNYLSNCTIA